MKRASNVPLPYNAGAGQLFKWWITIFSGEIEIGRSEFFLVLGSGGLSFPDLEAGEGSEFSGPGFSKFGACGGRGLGEGGLSFLSLRSGVVIPYISHLLSMCYPKRQVFCAILA